ncbi:hypothetical protein Nepgr_001958 [Nepenthes gracilis]|uniref:Uncharacterized protein n=1 Tax=Nepenthes gracilis TaxID=150966 RepID=A0AAD3P5E0_NEPGR|nr:hypothetical protein Nepgr_001958 [Nepenthes gracilis]
METATQVSMTAATRNWPSKRLLFDRRYGWVFDECKGPPQEALAGGRGMFCIVPLAKGLINVVSQLMHAAASSAIKILDRTDFISPQQLQASIGEEFHTFMTSIKKPEILTSKGNPLSPPTSSSLHLHVEPDSSQESECI